MLRHQFHQILRLEGLGSNAAVRIFEEQETSEVSERFWAVES